MELDATTFSRQWARACNSLDVEAVLTHFHEDVAFTSPVAAKMFPETAGVIRGKDALRHYWTDAVQRIPGLNFVAGATTTA